ncbi:hypothetical protein, partial [Faecalibaculum rodentium]
KFKKPPERRPFNRGFHFMIVSHYVSTAGIRSSDSGGCSAGCKTGQTQPVSAQGTGAAKKEYALAESE